MTRHYMPNQSASRSVTAVIRGMGALLWVCPLAVLVFAAPRSSAADGLDIRTEVTVSSGWSWRDRAVLIARGSDGVAQAIVAVTRGAVEVAAPHAAGVPLSFEAPSRLAAGPHSLLLKQRGHGLVVCLDGRVLGTHPGVRVSGRPDISLFDGRKIAFTGRARVQKVGRIDFADGFARLITEGEPQWETLCGEFALNTSRNPGSSQSAFQLWAAAQDTEGIAVAVQSRWFWDDYEAGVSAKVTAWPACWGLIVGYTDAGDYHLLCWSQADARSPGTVQLVRRHGGRETVLAEGVMSMKANQWYRLTVGAYGTLLKAFVGGRLVAKADDPLFVGGRIGLYVNRTDTVYFDDVSATSLSGPIGAPAWKPGDPFGPSEQQWSDFSKKSFFNDEFMIQWAHPRSLWDQQDDTGMAWFRTRFFSDVEATWTREKGQRLRWPKEPVRIALFADPADANSGYRFSVGENAVELARNGEVVARAQHGQKGLDHIAAVAADGRVTLRLNEVNCIEWQDPRPLTKGRVGADLGDTVQHSLRRPDWRDTFRIESSHRLDYAFEHAPAAWEAQSGTWRGTHRWACVPKWSFFGGRGEPGPACVTHGNAMLWNLRRFEGDFDLEVFAAPMEGTPQRVHFSWPVQLGVAFGADGRELDSGYFLLYGAYDMPTRLFLHGQEVARNDSRVDPGLRLQPMPWYHRVTRVWQHIRVQRRDGRIQVDIAGHDNGANYLGLKRFFDIEDSASGEGQRFGLWTSGPNGLAVARATISFEHTSGPADSDQNQALPNPQPDPDAIRRHNREAGGSFDQPMSSEPRVLAPGDRLRFKWRSPDPVAISLLAEVRGQTAEAVLAGPEVARPFTIPLGDVSRTEARWPEWNEISIDLGSALRRAFPDGPLTVDRIAVGSPYDRIEEIAGLGVNRWGALYDVKDVEWTSGTPAAAPPAAAIGVRVHDVEVLDDFERSIGQWSTLGGHDGALLYRDRYRPASGDASLRLLNPVVAGPAGAWITRTPYPLDRFPELTFDYRVPAGVEINLIVVANKRWFEVRLSGSDNTWPLIGTVSSWVQDGEWHRARVDLKRALAGHLRGAVTIDALALADTWRMSTRQRTAYWVDNVCRVPAATAGAETRFELIPPAGRRIVAHSLRMDAEPDTDVETKATGEGAVCAVTPVPEHRFAHIRAQFADGSWSDVCHVPVSVVSSPLQEDAPAPPAAPVPGEGPPRPVRILYRPVDRLCLTEFEWNRDPAFPESQFEEACIRRGAWLLRCESDAAAGRGSVEMVNLNSGSFFSAYLRRAGWDPERWPMVSFDYKFEQPGCALNLSMLVNEAMTIVEWTGPNAPNGYFGDAVIGRTERAAQDAQWHHVEFNLRDMILASRFSGQDRHAAITVSELATWATNHHGHGYVNPQGARVRFDNIAIYATASDAAAFEWTPEPQDEPPVGYSVVFDQTPDTVPPESVSTNENEARFADLGPGTWFLHVRACSPEGTWSETARRKIELTPVAGVPQP